MSATDALDAYLEIQLASSAAGTSRIKQPKSKGSNTAGHSVSKTTSSKENTDHHGDDGPTAQQPVKRRPTWPPSPLEGQGPLLQSDRNSRPKVVAKKPSAQALQRLKQQATSSRSAPVQQLHVGQTEAPEHAADAQPLPAHAAASSVQHADRSAAAAGAPATQPSVAKKEAPKQAAVQRRAHWDSSADEEAMQALGIMLQARSSAAGHGDSHAAASQLPMHAAPVAGSAEHHPARAAAAAGGRQGVGAHAHRAPFADQEAGATSEADTHGAAAREENMWRSDDDRQAAQVLEELLSELRAAEEKEDEARSICSTSSGSHAGARGCMAGRVQPDSLVAAARQEAGALGAAVSLYKGVQERQMRAGLRSDPVLALLPGPIGNSGAAGAQLQRQKKASAAEEPRLAPVRRMLEAFDAEAPIQAPLPHIGDAEEEDAAHADEAGASGRGAPSQVCTAVCAHTRC